MRFIATWTNRRFGSKSYANTKLKTNAFDVFVFTFHVPGFYMPIQYLALYPRLSASSLTVALNWVWVRTLLRLADKCNQRLPRRHSQSEFYTVVENQDAIRLWDVTRYERGNHLPTSSAFTLWLLRLSPVSQTVGQSPSLHRRARGTRAHGCQSTLLSVARRLKRTGRWIGGGCESNADTRRWR